MKTKINETAQFWRTEELSVRASNCLAKANITDEQQLIEAFTTLDCLLALRNCGRKTAEEIWTFLTNLKTCCVPNYNWETEITSSNLTDEPSAETQSVFIPLLNVKVSIYIWENLQKTPINSIQWSVRTGDVINQQGLQRLAEIAELSPKQWLRFRNFGRKSLTEIQETVNKIIANPNVIDPKAEHSAAIPQIQTLAELGRTVFQRLQTRQQEIVKYYYSYEGTRKNLQQIGEALGITRERVRQIKATVNKKINQGANNHLITTTIFYLLSESIRDVLAKAGGYCSAKNLQEIIHQRLGWGDSEQWIIDWFDEALGEAWICLGTDDYKIIDGVCHLKSGADVQGFLTELAAKLQRYGYRPLALEECQHLIQKTDKIAFDSDRLLDVITSYPVLEVYRYGKTHIGLKAWTWFNPDKPTTATGRASLIEWYLRMTNEPATAKAIANGIGSQLGNFRLTPFDVANICEKRPYHFQVDDSGAYSLCLWEEAPKYRQALIQLLSDEPSPIERIFEVLSPQEPAETTLIVAALNFYTDSFVETLPFEWALKSQTDRIEAEAVYNCDSSSTDFDYTNLRFEDLMPKL